MFVRRNQSGRTYVRNVCRTFTVIAKRTHFEIFGRTRESPEQQRRGGQLLLLSPQNVYIYYCNGIGPTCENDDQLCGYSMSRSDSRNPRGCARTYLYHNNVGFETFQRD